MPNLWKRVRALETGHRRARIEHEQLVQKLAHLERDVRELEPAVFPAEAHRRATREMRYTANLTDEELCAMYAGRRP